jgi:uncharacterized protein YndB with AHSA1/START domain
MSELPQELQRTVVIQASRETVFRYFTDSSRWAKWWGPGSTIDARPGGRMYIRYPNGVEVSGEVVEVVAPERISFTYGYESGKPMGPGASRVTISLQNTSGATTVHLRHEFDEAATRDAHIPGWRYQLSVFANVVANENYGKAADIIDRWYAAWGIGDDSERQKELSTLVTDRVNFRDRNAMISGLADLSAHISASLRFMPGFVLKRSGEIRHCQGNVLATWSAENADRSRVMKGTSVFALAVNGQIDSVVSFAD